MIKIKTFYHSRTSLDKSQIIKKWLKSKRNSAYRVTLGQIPVKVQGKLSDTLNGQQYPFMSASESNSFDYKEKELVATSFKTYI